MAGEKVDAAWLSPPNGDRNRKSGLLVGLQDQRINGGKNFRCKSRESSYYSGEH